MVEPRSLLLLKDAMYENYLHAIAEIKEDDLTDKLILNLNSCKSIDLTTTQTIQRETRYSLTIRHVPKTSKMKIKLGK